jgi:hypothetical protein
MRISKKVMLVYLMMLLPIQSFGSRKDCFVNGPDDENAINIIKNFTPMEMSSPLWVKNQGLSIRVDNFEARITNECTVRELNEVLKKYSLCLGKSWPKKAVISFDTKIKTYQEFKKLLADVIQEKCIRNAFTHPLPSPG